MAFGNALSASCRSRHDLFYESMHFMASGIMTVKRWSKAR